MSNPLYCKHDWENFGMCVVCRDCQKEKYDRCDACDGKLQDLSDHLCRSCLSKEQSPNLTAKAVAPARYKLTWRERITGYTQRGPAHGALQGDKP